MNDVFTGKGCVFSFDPVGSYERETYRAGGSAASMLQPLLDNQVEFKNHLHLLVRLNFLWFWSGLCTDFKCISKGKAL